MALHHLIKGLSMRLFCTILACLLILVGCEKNKYNIAPLPVDEFVVIAHRGASAYAPEHTMLAYEIAKQSGTNYIEIDLQMTKDGVLIAMHDENVDRTTDGSGFVKEFTLSELKLLNAGKWFNEAYPELANEEFNDLEIPTLEEIFMYFEDDVHYFIEMKSPGIYKEMEEELVRLLNKYNLIRKEDGLPKVVIEAFNEDSLIEMHKLEPKLPLVKLYSFKEEAAALSVQDYKRLRTYASGIAVNIGAVDKDFIEEVHLNHLQIYLYTINNETDLNRAWNLQVNGVFTDAPHLALNFLQQIQP